MSTHNYSTIIRCDSYKWKNWRCVTCHWKNAIHWRISTPVSLHHFRLRRLGGFSRQFSEARFAINGLECSWRRFVLKFSCFINCNGACVFLKHLVENIWWCGEDSAKDLGLKHLNFVGVEDFYRTPEFYAISRFLVTFWTQ